MIGFYGFALTISAVLLAIPFAEYALIKRVHFQFLIPCWGAGGAIVWALLPRRDRFEPPGPQLSRTEVPTLFAIIDDVAAKTAQPAPREVYLVGNVNAWVTHRGGLMGFGSRRVMGVGLPLLQTLSADEVRAVIAHEFGHYDSGDVALGPWIYKTRAAIFRSLDGVHRTFVEGAFTWYARMFMRMTMAISRRQEFVADAIAARVAGGAVMASALKKVATLAPAYDAYFRHEVTPLLGAGFLPPIAQGFTTFLEHPRTQAILESNEAHTIGEPAGEFDSHPSMADRIDALNALPVEGAPTTGHLGTRVDLADPDNFAARYLRVAFGADNLDALAPVRWEDTAGSVYLPHFMRLAQTHAEWLGDLTIDTLPAGRQAYVDRGAALSDTREGYADAEAHVGRALSVLTAAVTAAMARAGWTIETGPGRSIDAVRGADIVVPRDVVCALADGSLSPTDWAARATALGLAGVRLRPDAVTGAPPSL